MASSMFMPAGSSSTADPSKGEFDMMHILDNRLFEKLDTKALKVGYKHIRGEINAY